MNQRETIELRIDKIVAGGDGLGRHDGLVVFVPGVAAGERVLVESVRRRRDFVHARLLEVLELSPTRREPPCRFYASCGGCSLMHLDVETQLEAKREILRESLTRNGGLDYPGPIETCRGPELGYRIRSRFHVRRTRHGSLVGLLERGTHRIVDIDECLQLTSTGNGALVAVRRWLAEEPRRADGLRELEILEAVRADDPDASGPVVHFLVRGSRSYGTASLAALAERAGLSGVLVTDEHGARRGAWGTPIVLHRVAGYDLQASAASFFQSNRFLLEDLVGKAASEGERGLERAVDLYCGVGLFTLPLASRARVVHGVETSPVAVADARANARRAELDALHFRCGSALDFAAEGGLEGTDCVVADPPRGGLEPGVIDSLSKSRPRELRYVSCDPAAFGRDAGRLAHRGWTLERLVLFDLFPNTHHFETLGVFTPFRERIGTGPEGDPRR